MAADQSRGLAKDTMIETAEGPVAMCETPNKGFAVMTRMHGRIAFRQLIKLTTQVGVPLVRVTLDTGHRIVAAAGHPFFRLGMESVPARELKAGDVLETAFNYREGYVPPDAGGFTWRPGIGVAAVEAAGEGEVLTGTVRDTHTLFLTAGVLCGE
ncbi:MAG: Hint domain-containing protein [Candidatus Binatia bacterium]